MKLNGNFQNLEQSYLFVTIAKKVAAYTQEHPENKIIKMGIGDVTMPLAPAVIQAMHDATEEQAHKETFHATPRTATATPSCGRPSPTTTRTSAWTWTLRGVCGRRRQERRGQHCGFVRCGQHRAGARPGVPCVCGHQHHLGRNIAYMDANEQNGFLPLPDESVKADIIYLCSPTTHRATYNKEQLQAWVDYALEQKAVILFDAAYEAFITEPGLPHSIFEIPGAEKCAIEFCSFSKTAGFTGMRCGYTTIRKELVVDGVQVSKLWQRRQGCKFKRHQLYHPAGRCRGVHRRGPEADSGDHRLLPEQRQGDDGRLYKNGRVVHRRHQLPLYLAEVPERHGQLGVL